MKNFLVALLLSLGMCVSAAQAQTTNFGFTPTGSTQNISVTGSSSSITLNTTPGESVLIQNTGTATAYLKAGTTAATTDFPLQAGWGVVFNYPPGQVIAAITGGSSTTLTVSKGLGATALTGGGGSGSGGGGSATAGAGQIFPITNDMTTTSATTTTGQSIGGLQTLANAVLTSGTLGTNNTSGYIQNLTVSFTDAVGAGPLDVYYFNASPSGSTCTNDSAFILANADRDKVIGIVHVTDFTSSNTAVIAQANNISMGYGLSSATSIFACVVARASFVIAGTTNVSLLTNVLRKLMLRLGAFIFAWLAALPAFAGMPPNMRNPQVRPANAIAGTPAVDDILGAGGYPIAGGVCAEWGHQVPCNNHYSIVRASTKYVSASDGLYASVPAGVFGLGSNNGALIEEARTNDALWSRDMTNAAWVKTTMTTALNAVGIDGTANSATTLTATGASAMAVQTITLASQADNYSVFLKRVTGSATINLCLAATACGTATACTVTSTTTFTRCTVTATVLNPIVGIQIATNGDAVVADFNQMEPGGFPLSPILTTSATANRSGDNVNLIGLPKTIVNGPNGAFVIALLGAASPTTAGSPSVLDKSAAENYMTFNSPTVIESFINGSFRTATVGSGTAAGAMKCGNSFSSSGTALVGNGGAVTDTVAYTSSTVRYTLGSLNSGASNYYDGYFSRNTFFAATLPDTSIQSWTHP